MSAISRHQHIFIENLEYMRETLPKVFHDKQKNFIKKIGKTDSISRIIFKCYVIRADFIDSCGEVQAREAYCENSIVAGGYRIIPSNFGHELAEIAGFIGGRCAMAVFKMYVQSVNGKFLTFDCQVIRSIGPNQHQRTCKDLFLNLEEERYLEIEPYLSEKLLY